ncbi:hypothetical protein QQM79_02480 [Marinobacteraceae bacterium S3BR75-40.1]
MATHPIGTMQPVNQWDRHLRSLAPIPAIPMPYPYEPPLVALHHFR